MCPLPRGSLSVSPLPARLQPSLFLPAIVVQVGLEQRLEAPVDLVLTDNRRSLIRVRRKDDGFHLRLHHLFIGADESCLDALAALARQRSSQRARRFLRDYAAHHQGRIRRREPKRRMRIRTKGRHYDLQRLYNKTAASVVDDPSEVLITWGRHGKQGPQSQIRLGSYDPRRRLIRIHPLLDRPEVPAWVIEFVIFHELLHHVIPTRRKRGRRIVHSREFLARERAHPDHDRFEDWCAEHLGDLLAGK